jgi:P27 family predicted phage terminase small subunit
VGGLLVAVGKRYNERKKGKGSMKGRKPRPTNLRLLFPQTNGERPTNGIDPARVCPDPPAHLNEYAREEWQRMAAILDRLGLLTEIDLVAFELYCALYGRWRQAEAGIAEQGLTIHEGTKRNPCVAIASDAAKMLKSTLSEFGMTPCARARVTRAEGGTEDDEFEQFLEDGGQTAVAGGGTL